MRTFHVVPMPQKAQEVPDKSFMASTEQGTGAEVTGPPMGEGGGGLWILALISPRLTGLPATGELHSRT